MVVQLVPELVELGVGQEEGVQCQGNENFADDFDGEASDGQQPRTHRVGGPQENETSKRGHGQRQAEGQGAYVASPIRIGTGNENKICQL